MNIEAPKGCSLNIYGDNGTGKTTVADSVTFVLFGKDTKGRSPDNFGIKTLENGEEIHHLEHSVEAAFIEPDITLKRVYKEVWSRKRGSAEKVLDRHTTDYFINGDEMKKNEFEDKVSEIITDQQFKILTIPSYFAEDYHWSDRRKVLASMAGDVDAKTVINLSPAADIDDYPEIVGDRDPDKVKESLKKKRTDLIDALDEYPVKIEENSRQLTPVNLDDVDSKMSELEETKDELTEKLSVARSGGGVSDLQAKLEEIESERQKLVAEHTKSVESELLDARKALNEARSAEDEAFELVRDAKACIDYEETKVELAQREVESIKGKIEEIESQSPPEKPKKSENGDCPYCGRPIDSDNNHEEKIKKWKSKLAEFNESKAKKLKSLSEDLESAQTVLNERQKALKKAEESHQKAKNAHGEVKNAVEEAKKPLEEAKNTVSDVHDTDAYKELIERRDKLNKKIEAMRSDKQSVVDEVQEHIAAVTADIKALEEKKFQHKQNEQIKARIKELKDELNSTQQDLEDVEHSLYVIESFELAQAKIITSRVNELFDIVEWKMFEPLMNGGINNQMCEAVVDGVPYGDGLNNAMRVQAGIDIIHTISKHYGETAPVILDNAESVVRLNTYGLQIISLYVSEDDQKLRVEEV